MYCYELILASLFYPADFQIPGIRPGTTKVMVGLHGRHVGGPATCGLADGTSEDA